MEQLTALELFILLTSVELASESKNAERFKILFEYLSKKLKSELMSRDDRELRAAFMDLKNIDPDLSRDVNFALFAQELASRFKRKQQ